MKSLNTNLTDKQKNIYTFIENYIHLHAKKPSLEIIAKKFNSKIPTISDHLSLLRKKRLLDGFRFCPHCGVEIKKIRRWYCKDHGLEGEVGKDWCFGCYTFDNDTELPIPHRNYKLQI